jgi:hypothetical protein
MTRHASVAMQLATDNSALNHVLRKNLALRAISRNLKNVNTTCAMEARAALDSFEEMSHNSVMHWATVEAQHRATLANQQVIAS